MKLTVFQNSIDLTLKMDDLSSSFKVIDLSDGEILIGFHKPVHDIYVEQVARVDEDDLPLESVLVATYYNGSTYENIPKIEDKTFGFVQSGLISWPEIEDQEKSTLHSIEAYWIKLTADTSAPVSINGINLVLSNDEDLSFVPNIMAHLSSPATSFIAFHQEARNLIVQRLRNSGMKITGYECADIKQVDQFDLLDIEEFKQASKYLALSLIFEDLSKSDDDQYFTKSERYFDKYEASLNDRLISIDLNNNGIKDEGENLAAHFIRITRE